MNIWKNLAKHGRGGDTMMKKIDGDLAHVNAVEYEMSPEYIKEHGAGTINPITGKKEYQAVPPVTPAAATPWGAIGLGFQVGSSIMSGFDAMGNKADVEKAKKAAKGMYEEQLGFLGEQKDIGLEIAETQYTGGVTDVSTGTGAALTSIKETSDIATSKSNLATPIDKTKTQTDSLFRKYKNDITKLFETRDLSKAEADLSY